MTQERAVPPEFWERVRKIAAEEAAKSYRSAPLRNASISEGGDLSVRGGAVRVYYRSSQGGGNAVYFGDLVSGTDYVGTGMLVEGPDGTDIASFSYNFADGSSTANLHDEKNNIIVGNDSVSGQGLARPYVPMGGFFRAKYSDWTVQTTSATFETLWRGELLKQHPKLSVATNSSMDTSGSTGELRVLVNGVQLGTTATINFALTTTLFGPTAVDGSHMQLLAVEIQGRVASGAGALRVEPLHAIGRQS